MQTEASISLGVNCNQVKLQLDDSKTAQLETAECADQSRHEEESGNNPQDFIGKQDEDDRLLSLKDSSTGTKIMENVHFFAHSSWCFLSL
jgi:hypothetical protein